MNPIRLLVTLDERYVPPLLVMLHSAFINNPNQTLHIYLIHETIPVKMIQTVQDLCRSHGGELFPIQVAPEVFGEAPVVAKYYSKAMYYRLLACHLLPQDLDKIIYIDPDTLIINPLRELYDTPLDQFLFGACSHKGIVGVTVPLNRMRIREYKGDDYFNSGVLLLNLPLQREEITEEELNQYVEKHKKELVLPDQDVLNGLWAHRILPLDESLYNYDIHHYESYHLSSKGEKNLKWVMENTVILHFCGKIKPWHKMFVGRYGMLWTHYAAMTKRHLKNLKKS